MFVTGAAIFLGLVLIFIKLPRRTMLRLLRHVRIPEIVNTDSGRS